jgi:hypothetical protein
MRFNTNANLNVTATRCDRATVRQRGYALLMLMFFIALMMIAVTAAGPRILQEGKRDKEQEMVWRGKQYIRGIKLYYKKTGRFPRELDDLTKPKLGSLRFMRQAYKDPMNGEDGSWRMLYVGPAGNIIGSLKPPEMLQIGGAGGLGASASSVASASTGQNQSAFGGGNSSFGGGNSSFGGGNSSFGGGNSSFGGGGNNSSSSFGGNSGSAFGNSSFNNSTNGQQQQGQPGQPGQQNGQGPGTVQAGGTNPDGSAVNANSVGDSTSTNGGTPDQQGIANSESTIIGGNIIGVGSKKVAPSLMVYEKAKNYHLFEFVWDPSKDTTVAGAPVQTGTGLGQGIGTGIGTGNGSAFGNGGLNNSNGSNSSFGNSSFGNGNNTNSNASPGAGAPNPNPNPEPPTQAPPNPPPDQQQQ